MEAGQLNTYAILERRDAPAVVGFVLVKEVNEVKNVVALSAYEDVRRSHFFLCPCNRQNHRIEATKIDAQQTLQTHLRSIQGSCQFRLVQFFSSC